MDLTEWTTANRICLENLEIHLQHWENLRSRLPKLPHHLAASHTLGDCIDHHTYLAMQTRVLLAQQRSLIAQVEAHLIERRR